MSKKEKNTSKKSLGQLITQGINKLKEMIKFVFAHWSKAPEGKSLSFKEMAAYCVGGMGVAAANILPTYLSLSAGMYIAAALNFNIADIAIVGVASSIFTILKSPIVGMLVDNTKSKFGKFRPYLIWMPVPAMICIVLIGWIPQLLLPYSYIAMVIVFAILFNLLQVFMQLYTLAFNSLIQVISPSPEERTGLLSFGSVVYSLGPSIVSFFLPMLAGLFSIKDPETGKVLISGLNQIGTYKWIIPALALVFFALGYWTAFGTKERVVVSKKFVQKVKFFDGVKKTVQNRYFWLTVISTAMGVFRVICSSFTTWICIYLIQNDLSLSIANAVLGMAYVPGMLFAPLLIKKFGKKNLVITSNFLLAGISIFMMFFVHQPILLLVFSLFAIMSNSIQVVTAPAMVAQYYDYQQYKTGDRLEGFLSQFAGMIGSVFGIFTALVPPAISAAFGYTNDNNVLYQENVISNIIRVSLMVGAGSAILGAVPYFFWNLTEKKHRQIMDVLAIRAKQEDGEISLEDEKMLEAKIEAGEPDVIKNYFHKSEDELLKEQGAVFAEAAQVDGATLVESVTPAVVPAEAELEFVENQEVVTTEDAKADVEPEADTKVETKQDEADKTEK